MILSDSEIKDLALNKEMIKPFSYKTKTNDDGSKAISYGLGYFGYDVRLSNRILHSPRPLIVDPKNIDVFKDFEEVKTDLITISPNDFILGISVEYFNIPEDIIGICLGKSTYARCGVDVNITPLEPGWKGYIVMEIANLSSRLVRIYTNEGIAQVLFLRGLLPSQSYSGYYQNQDDFKVGI